MELERLLNCKTVESYTKCMEELQQTGMLKKYELFLNTNGKALHKMYLASDKAETQSKLAQALQIFYHTVCTEDIKEAYDTNRLNYSPTGVFFAGWYSKSDGRVGVANYNKIEGVRSGISLDIFKQLFLNSLCGRALFESEIISGNILYKDIYPYTVAEMLQLKSELNEMSNTKFNQMLNNTLSIIPIQGICCNYSKITFIGVIDGIVQHQTYDKSYRGLKNVYIKREYLYLLLGILPDAYYALKL